MIRAVILVSLCLVTSLLGGSQSAAMVCAESPLAEDVIQADAIFTGTIAGVRRLWFDGIWGPCASALGSEKCGSKIATVSVAKVWKGDPGENTTVYSEDACYCLGSYLTVGDEMLFVVVRDKDRDDADYRTEFCVRTVPLDAAKREGVIEELDKLLVSPGPAN